MISNQLELNLCELLKNTKIRSRRLQLKDAMAGLSQFFSTKAHSSFLMVNAKFILIHFHIVLSFSTLFLYSFQKIESIHKFQLIAFQNPI